MSAHIGDKRLETIEIDLKRLIISQSHGAYNQDTKYHNRIGAKEISTRLQESKSKIRKR